MTYELGDLVARMKLDATDFREGLATLSGTGGGAAPVFAALRNEITGLNQSFWQLQRDAQSMSTIGYTLAGSLAAPTAALAFSTKTYADFDQQMTRSQAIMGDVSAEMKGNMADAARTLADETIFSAKQSASAYYYLGSAGMSAAESIEALPVVEKFAQAGHMELQKATEILAQSQTALGLAVRDDATRNMKEMARVADVLVRADTLANATTQEFALALTNKGAAALRLYHKDVEEGVAVLAAWSEQGVKGAMAGNWLSIVLRDLQTQAIKHPDVFKRLGITVYDASGNMRDMADIIGNLEQRFSGLSDKQIRAELRMLGFQDRSVQALQSLIGMSTEIRRFEGEFDRAGGTVDKVSKRQIANLNDQLTVLWHRAQDIAMVFGEPVAKALQGLVSDFNQTGFSAVEFRNSLNSLPTPISTVISLGGTAVIGLGAMSGTLLIVSANALRAAASIQYLGGMGVVIGGLTTAIGGLGIAAGALTGIGLAVWSLKKQIDIIGELNRDNNSGKIGNQMYLSGLFSTGLRSSTEMISGASLKAMKMLGLGPVEPLGMPGIPALITKTTDELQYNPYNFMSAPGTSYDQDEANTSKYFSSLGLKDYRSMISDMEEALSGLSLSAEQRFRGLQNLKGILFDAFNAGAIGAEEFESKLKSVEDRVAETGHRFNDKPLFDWGKVGLGYLNLSEQFNKELNGYRESAAEVKRLRDNWDLFLKDVTGGGPPVIEITTSMLDVLTKINQEIGKSRTGSGIYPNVVAETEALLSKYGITSSADLKSAARQAEADYDRVVEVIGADTDDGRRMWVKMVEAQIRAGDQLPPEVLKQYQYLRSITTDGMKSMEAEWREVATITHQAFRNFSREIAANIVEWEGWGQSVKNIGQTLAVDFLSIITHQLLKPLEDQLAKLALGIAGSIARAFGGGASAVVQYGPTMAQLTGTGAGIAAGAGGGLSGVIGKAVGSTLTGTLTAIFSGISAIGSIGGLITGSRTNTLLYRIETDLRGLLNVTALNGSGSLVDSAIRTFHEVQAVHAIMSNGAILASEGGSGGGNLYINTVTVNGVTNVDQFVAELKRRRIVRGV